jgi:hypothetical protein
MIMYLLQIKEIPRTAAAGLLKSNQQGTRGSPLMMEWTFGQTLRAGIFRVKVERFGEDLGLGMGRVLLRRE